MRVLRPLALKRQFSDGSVSAAAKGGKGSRPFSPGTLCDVSTRVAFATPNATGLLTPEALLNGERESFETENEPTERNPGVLGVRRLDPVVGRESGPETAVVASRWKFTGKRKTPRAGGSRRFV